MNSVRVVSFDKRIEKLLHNYLGNRTVRALLSFLTLKGFPSQRIQFMIDTVDVN